LKTTSTIKPPDAALKETLVYTLLGIVVLGGSFFIGRTLIRNARSSNEQKKTFEEGNPAAFAQQLKMAFENDNYFGWGTDENIVRTVIRKIPTKEFFKRVIQSYQKLYATSLMSDLKNELTTSEYNEMIAIITAKPDSIISSSGTKINATQYVSWAKRLKAAFDITYWFIPGTDEEAIKAVFMEIPTQKDFQQVAAAYLKEFGNELIGDLKAELEFWEYAQMMELMNKKPKA
jgi:hypothetical protein